MNSMILIKYGELTTKGDNRKYFIKTLCENIEERLSSYNVNIAKEYSMDYSNIMSGKARKQDIELFNNIIKRKILSMFLYELLTDDEKESISEMNSLITFYYEKGINEFDIIDICNIKRIINILKND